ncbi:M67 family metallopeptidase [Cohnella sp. JJ-181]|uniref:M67 family metallopeptidase n=1 Tax=Cohnella rhizoplanae TaxID=2974897 RepID=UPI00232DF6B1|nr:M67 family metallopeptidase [Cohnella sp. JJ-181]
MPHYANARIAQQLLDRLVEGCRAALPREACGILLGDHDGSDLAVADLLFIPNAASTPRSAFFFEPAAWVAAAYAAQKSRQAIVGFFHSHPDSPPLPSRSDRRGWHGYGSYWIVGFGSSAPEVRLFKLNGDGEWTAMTLTVR